METRFRTAGPRKRMLRVKLTEAEGVTLEAMAARLGWSMSDVVREAIERYLEAEAVRRPSTPPEQLPLQAAGT